MTPQDQNDELRIVPQSREAEEAVIGSILINPGAYYDVAEILEADDFYIHRHRWIWDAFTALQKSNTPIDSLTVVEHLARKDQLTQLGGPAYITQLINAVPTSLNAVSYAHIVEETATRRRMLEAANTIAQLAYRENQSLDDVVDAAVREVHEITDQVHKRDLIPFSQIMDLLHTHVDAAEQARQRGEALGVYTGFRKLDALLMGLQPADLIVVAARPGVGKTSLLLTIIKQAAQQKTPKHTAIFSLEMPN
nr:replicative DNA helicase [Chloroflexota bacterium]